MTYRTTFNNGRFNIEGYKSSSITDDSLDAAFLDVSVTVNDYRLHEAEFSGILHTVEPQVIHRKDYGSKFEVSGKLVRVEGVWRIGSHENIEGETIHHVYIRPRSSEHFTNAAISKADDYRYFFVTAFYELWDNFSHSFNSSDGDYYHEDIKAQIELLERIADGWDTHAPANYALRRSHGEWHIALIDALESSGFKKVDNLYNHLHTSDGYVHKVNKIDFRGARNVVKNHVIQVSVPDTEFGFIELTSYNWIGQLWLVLQSVDSEALQALYERFKLFLTHPRVNSDEFTVQAQEWFDNLFSLGLRTYAELENTWCKIWRDFDGDWHVDYGSTANRTVTLDSHVFPAPAHPDDNDYQRHVIGHILDFASIDKWHVED